MLVLLLAIFLASSFAYVGVMIFGDSVSFRTLFKKLTQIFLVLSIFPLMYWLKLNKSDLGIAGGKVFFKQFAQGWVLGFITLLPVFALLFVLDVKQIDTARPWTLGWFSKKLILEFLLAMLISLFEEPVFRGILLASLSRILPLGQAIAISAFYYAGLHFVNSNTEISAHAANVFSGFTLLQDAIGRLFNPAYFSPFLALFTVGVFLGLLRTQIKTSLGICIGCHAAWVWLIKLNKSLFNTNPQSEYLFLVSRYDGVIGPLITLWLAITITGYLAYKRNAHKLLPTE
jgi:uncharacterized protein